MNIDNYLKSQIKRDKELEQTIIKITQEQERK
jgi:hypothetical protein